MARIMSVSETPFSRSSNSQQVHGHVVCWDLPKAKTTFSAVASALVAAGLDEAEARAKLPANVIRGVLKALDKTKLVDRVETDETHVYYQVSHKLRVQDGLTYDRDIVVAVNKTDATVTSTDDPARARQIQDLVNEALGQRSGGDIIAIGHRCIMKANIDILPHRKRGGSYYFPVKSFDVLDKVEHFYRLLGVEMSRLPIFKGDERGDQEVSQLVCSGVDASIGELRESIQGITIDTRISTFEARAEEVRLTRLKVECYAELMIAERQRLLDALDAADLDLVAAVDRIAGVPPSGDDQEEAQHDAGPPDDADLDESTLEPAGAA